MATSHGLGNIVRAFRIRDYRIFQLGRFFYQSATWMYRMSVAWMVWDMTQSATWLGIFGFLDLAPSVVVMPLAGALSDRVDQIKLIKITQSMVLLQAVVLSVLIMTGWLTLWMLVVLTLYFGIFTSMQNPATQAVIPSLVPKDHLTTAYGINSLSFNLSRFLGPMLAGLIINLWGTAPAIFCNALGAAGFMACLTVMRVKIKPRDVKQAARPGVMLREVGEGLRYATRHPGIGPMMLILVLLSLAGFSIDQLLPSLADGVYGQGAHGLAWMTSVMGIGAMCQAAHLAQRGGVSGVTNYVVGAILAMVLGFSILWLTEVFWLGLLGVFFIGFAASAIRVGAQTLLQYAVDADMRGRVASFYGVIYHAGPAFGAVFVGALGDTIGVPRTMGVVAVLVLLIWCYGLYRRRPMRAALEGDPSATEIPKG